MGKAVTSLNAANDTRYFYPADDQWKLKMMPFLASSAIAEWAAVAREISSNTTTGNLTTVTLENITGSDFVGILAEPIETTDADYASAGKLKAVRVPMNQYAESYFAVGAGTFTAADVGKTVEITTWGSLGLSVDTAGKGARITGYISSTKGKCIFDLPATETA